MKSLKSEIIETLLFAIILYGILNILVIAEIKFNFLYVFFGLLMIWVIGKMLWTRHGKKSNRKINWKKEGNIVNNVMNSIKSASPKKVRTTLFIISMGIFLLSYAILPKDTLEYSSASSFLKLIGIFILVQSFSYKLRESELTLHTIIRENTPRPFKSTLLFLAILFSLTLIAFYIYSFITNYNWVEADPLTQVLLVLFSILMSFTFSLWDRWSILRRSLSGKSLQ